MDMDGKFHIHVNLGITALPSDVLYAICSLVYVFWLLMQVVNWMRSWTVHNPQFDTWFWTDSAVRRLLEFSFPSWLVKLYDSYPSVTGMVRGQHF